MPYITENKSVLQKHHYVQDATTSSLWFNFYTNKLNKLLAAYGEDFCLVINGSNAYDDAYVLPIKQFRDFFSADYIDSRDRWNGHVVDNRIQLSLRGKPTKSMSVGRSYNAFDLLHPPSDSTNTSLQKDIVIVEHDSPTLSELSSLIQRFNQEYETTAPEKRIVVSNLIDRPNAITDCVKQLQKHVCQICGTKGFKKRDGSFYSEAHHIIELHKLILGSYCSDNIIIVCPTCHRKLHYAEVSYECKDEQIILVINGNSVPLKRNVVSSK